MKKILLLLLCSFSAFLSIGQSTPFTSLNENFNTACVLAGENYPSYWVNLNTMNIDPDLSWNCTPVDGRNNTPGVQCSGYKMGNHNDTAFLLTPKLDLSHYADSVYIRFDCKTSYFAIGAKLSVLYSRDSIVFDTIGIYSPDTAFTNLSNKINPVIGNGDSTGWVTHEVNLTPLKGAPLFVAFRYSSSLTQSSTWYLDNINTTGTSLSVARLGKELMSMSVIGNATTENIKLAYVAPSSGMYDVVIYDLVGRPVDKRAIRAGAGRATYMLDNLHLRAGIYFIKMGNDAGYGITKAIVQ